LPEKVYGKDAEKYIFRNLFIEDQDTKIAQSIWNYFSVVSGKWPQSWSNVRPDYILNRSTGFIALMRFFRVVYLAYGKPDEVLPKEFVDTVFTKININENDFTKANYIPGSSGQGILFSQLISMSGLRDSA
jgi:hypothetical protein